jgi:hypothetical protein
VSERKPRRAEGKASKLGYKCEQGERTVLRVCETYEAVVIAPRTRERGWVDESSAEPMVRVHVRAGRGSDPQI